MILEHPGCYGLPSAVNATSPSCQSCPSRVVCVVEAYQFLETLPNNPVTQRERQTLAVTRQALAGSPREYGRATFAPIVVASSRGVKRMLLDDAKLDEISRLPARVASQVRQLTERGWFDFARVELSQARNPALKGWKKIFCEALLDGGRDRSSLELALVEQLDLSIGSARMQTSVGISIFSFGRIATEKFGTFSLSLN